MIRSVVSNGRTVRSEWTGPYEEYDVIVAGGGTAGAIVGISESTVRNCYYAAENVFTVNGEPITNFANDIGESVAESELLTSEFLVQSLYWSSSVWSFEDGVLPELNWVAAKSAE